MFTCALGFVLPESSGNAEPQLQLVTSAKVCPCCKAKKVAKAFHSKGKGRSEHICKSCSNHRKSERRKQKNQIKKSRNAKNRTLSLSIVEVVGELDATSATDFANAYGNLLREVLNVTE